MRFYVFSEIPYPDFPSDAYERYGSVRVSLPNALCDPQVARRIYDERIEEWQYACELGMHVMVNEHHQTPTSLDAALCVTASAVVARTPGLRSRIILLGHPIANRNEPLRVAEETAMLDVMSSGRIECGFVRGVPTEIHPANANPVHNVERFREAHDLILRAWTAEEPFGWEGKHFQYRVVNLWPRPYQRPHPPIWITGGTTADNILWTAERGHRFAMFLLTYQAAERAVGLYRDHSRTLGLPEPGPDRFGYMALAYVADSDEQAAREGKELLWNRTASRSAAYFNNPPGYFPPAVAARGRSGEDERRLSWDELWERYIRDGLVIAGSPDTVRRQVAEHYRRCGSAHLMLMTHAGHLAHDRVMRSLRLFAEEVVPAFAGLGEEGMGEL